MIVNIDRTIKHISDYINSEIKSTNKKGVIIPISGGLNSSVAAILCKKANIPLFAFHLWHDNDIAERCREISNKYNLLAAFIIQERLYDAWDEDDCLELFRAGIVSAFCGNYANKHNYLVLGDLCRTKANLVRRYSKRLGDTADIYPFADLYRSEIEQIAKSFDYNRISGTSELHPKNISHEDRLHLKFSDIEWADVENYKTNILNAEPLNSAQYWYKYTLGQKEVLSRIQQIEKRTKHKKLLRPILILKDKEGLVV